MTPGAEGNRAGDGAGEGESNVNGSKMLQVLRPVVTSEPAVTVVFVGTEAVLQKRDRLPCELTWRLNAGALKSFADQLFRFAGDGIRLVGLRFFVMSVEDDRRSSLPDFRRTEV